MNNKSPATQPSKAVVPSKAIQPTRTIQPCKAIQPSKAVVPTSQNSITTPTAQEKKQTGIAVLGILELPKEDIANLLKGQVPQQSTNINITNNTQIINNYYNCPPPEAQNPGQQGGSRDRLHQGPQTTASASRAIEDKAHGADNVPSALKSTQKTQEKSQNGPGDKVNSSRSTKVQTHSVQDKSRVETSSAPIAKSITGQVASRPAQDGSKKPESATVLAVQAPGQDRREASKPKPKSSQVKEFIDKICHPDPPRENGSQPKKTAPTSSTTSPPRGSSRNHLSGSRDDSARQSQIRAKPQAAPHHSQAPSESRGRTASEQPVVRSQHQGSQPAKREESAGIHSSVTKSKDPGTAGVPEVPKELSEKDIRKHLGDLNSRLGNHQTGTNSGPARLILLSKAFAEMTGLKTDEKVYHIDVMLDGGERAKQTRQCMARMGVFREFDRPEQDATTKAFRTFFGTSAHRSVVLNDVAREGKCVFNKKHLKAYVMDSERAFEFELRRMADPGNDKQKTSENIAEAILKGKIALGCTPPSRDSCRKLRYIRADASVPIESIEKVL